MTARERFITDMMQELDVSRAAVEKAVENLQAKGLIEFIDVEPLPLAEQESFGDIPWKDTDGPRVSFMRDT